MGNRKKTKRPWLRLAASDGKALISQKGLAKDILAGPNEIITDEALEGLGIKAPFDEKVIVKEVPAKVDGTVVGTAQIYEDGTVGVVIDEDAPQWAKDKIKHEADLLGYEIGTLF